MLTLTRCTRCGADKIGAAGFCLTCETASDEIPPASPTPPTDPLLDRVRAATRGEYEIVRELGRGPLSAVYLARDLGLELEVAIKVLLPEHARRRRTASRFLHEAGRAAALGAHPNVARVYRAPERGGVRFLVMQHVDGSSLARVLRLAPRLPLGIACHVLAQAARALAHGHERGVAHGDVDATNVLLDRSGAVVVTDFAVAAVAVPNDTPSPAGDQRALGALAYEMLTGAPPRGDGGSAPARLSALRPDCPAALERLVHGMLAPSPADRWPDLAAVCAMLAEVEPEVARLSAAELVARLGTLAGAATPHVIRASPVHARPADPSARATPQAAPAAVVPAAPTVTRAASRRRRRWPVALAAGGVLAAAATIGAVLPATRAVPTPSTSGASVASPAAASSSVASPSLAPARLAVAPWRGDSARGDSARRDPATLAAAGGGGDVARGDAAAPAAPRAARLVIMTDLQGSVIAAGDSVLLRVHVLDDRRRMMPDADVVWSSSDTGRLALHRARAGVYAVAAREGGGGRAKVTAWTAGASGGLELRVDAPAAVRADAPADSAPALRDGPAARPE